MVGKPRNSLLEQLADLEDPVPKDFDPEDDRPVGSDDENHSDDFGDDDEAAGRDHYVSVGKSKLRKSEQQSLGPRYRGSRISREAALDGEEDEEEDDPFAKGFDEEDGSDSGLASNLDDHDTVDQDNISEASEGEESDSGSEGSDPDAARPPILGELSRADLSSIQRAQSQDQKSVAATLSRGAQEDIAKGRAVQKQRAAFDALLGIRIKLQKALVGGNTLAGLAQDRVQEEQDDTGEELETAFQAAETAAYTLWSSMTSLREQLLASRAGTKRSHAEFSADSSTADLWHHAKSQDTASTGHIDATLEKWFSKTHAVDSASQARPRLNAAAATPTSSASAVISSALADRSHLLKRARTPRSCAPYQLARQSKAPRPAVGDGETARDTIDSTVYDDADMYAVLLTTLLEQRGNATVTIDGSAAISGHAVRREAKTRRVVDTKASKGRKLRYTVHEKLMNFMAPRELGNWGDRQVDELFSSLFGRKVELGEEPEEEVEVGMDVEEDGEVETGLLFRR
ncbi:TRAUB-domain-containing protein [Myriangium duriaei CBS 260.36]|uniref:Protein BFR2 n=1 Tax=Myriangium duriaei CBS 260.36 TaxID=1168546 RepID=A0A9P4IYX8_9PEZI|nr:TRAUB-domain-containing protein [Myriangium duriaei CBS 260.36]